MIPVKWAYLSLKRLLRNHTQMVEYNAVYMYVCIWMYAELNTIVVRRTSYKGIVIHRLA